jgi:hypothetical protein
MITNPNQRETKTYEKSFQERKQVGDAGERCFEKYLESKYNQSQITNRQKENMVDFKLPDFMVTTKKGNYEFEVKTTNKIKVRDFNYQLQYALDKNLVLYYVYVKILNSHKFMFRAIEIRNILDYRVLYGQGVYPDPPPKAFFTVNWNLFLGQDYEKKWVEFESPYPIS